MVQNDRLPSLDISDSVFELNFYICIHKLSRQQFSFLGPALILCLNSVELESVFNYKYLIIGSYSSVNCVNPQRKGNSMLIFHCNRKKRLNLIAGILLSGNF